MKKVFGFVELNKEGMNLVNVTWSGPFKVIDLDPHFGVEILDHRNISHWIMKGNFMFLEDHTITDVLYLNNTQTIVDRIIQKMGEEHRERITTCKRSYLQTFSGQDGHVHDVQATIKELVDIQGRPGNWDQNDYMCGMYNGMELILATIENREPEYKSLEKAVK